MENKSQWRLNNKTVNMKQIEELTRTLNIQTGNLCQFLPQDKVHEFSKMDAKELLTKTIEAVGENQLKLDHQKLKVGALINLSYRCNRIRK